MRTFGPKLQSPLFRGAASLAIIVGLIYTNDGPALEDSANAIDKATLLKAVKEKKGYRRLEWKNAYRYPEQVVLYYAERDASGFVWTGLMDLERRAFTSWRTVPHSDTFLIAREFKIGKADYEGLLSNEAVVKVEYELLGIADANGTRLPPPSRKMEQSFRLKKVNGKWLIKSPAPKKIVPIVVESKFPYGLI